MRYEINNAVSREPLASAEASKSARQRLAANGLARRAGRVKRSAMEAFASRHTRRLFRLFVLMLICGLMLSGSAFAESVVANSDPILLSNGGHRFCVQGEFRPSVESARESALRAAQEQLREWLAKQQSPIHHVPSLETIRKEMNPREYALQHEQILNRQDQMFKMTMEFDLQPQQMRELRERDRVACGVWLLGGLLGLLGVVAVFFRLDEWTKGYLTRVLFIGGILVSIALGVAWWFGL